MTEAILFVAFVILELLFPYKKIPLIKKGLWVDVIWYYWLQDFLLSVLVYKFLFRFYSSYSLNIISALPIWIQFLSVFILIDFIFYWFHRWLHYGTWLWRIHEVHHSTVHLNWLSTVHTHALELIMVKIFVGGVLVISGTSERTMYLFFTVNMIHSFFLHSNINMRLGILNYIINTPEMHRIHHLNDIKYQKCNFAIELSLWDWLFGTAYLPKTDELKEIPYGVTPEYPQHILGQLFYLFRKKEKVD